MNLDLVELILCSSGLDTRDVYYNPKVHNGLFWKLKEIWLRINAGLISSYADKAGEEMIELLSDMIKDTD